MVPSVSARKPRQFRDFVKVIAVAFRLNRRYGLRENLLNRFYHFGLLLFGPWMVHAHFARRAAGRGERGIRHPDCA
jgi:hypothetical protein